MPSRPLASRGDALDLIRSLGASPRLVRHVELVGEAADLLLSAFDRERIAVDASRVRIGVVLHDVGKIRFPHELDQPGHDHEEAGEALLVAAGVDPSLARACVTHARWSQPGLSLEERLVALADKLWKGKREAALEELVIDQAASVKRCDRWDLFTALDEAFEAIASGADARLARSATMLAG